MNGCKKSVEKLLERMNATESTFNEWWTERKDLKNGIDNLKKVNAKRVKEIEKLKSENRGVREEVSGWKKSLENLLERINVYESNFPKLCMETFFYEKLNRQPKENKWWESKGDWEINKWKWGIKKTSKDFQNRRLEMNSKILLTIKEEKER